jgi:hypothetical protein
VSGDYDGRQVVGLDLHRNRTVMVRITDHPTSAKLVRKSCQVVAARASRSSAGSGSSAVRTCSPARMLMVR